MHKETDCGMYSAFHAVEVAVVLRKTGIQISHVVHYKLMTWLHGMGKDFIGERERDREHDPNCWVIRKMSSCREGNLGAWGVWRGEKKHGLWNI